MVADSNNPLDEPWRALRPEEVAVLGLLLATNFPGRSELAAQARSALARRIDREGSVRFQTNKPQAEVRERVPVEGYYHYDGSGPGLHRPAINLLLHVVDGRLHELEVYKDDGSAILIDPFVVPLAEIEVFTN
ncbi:hypothetical protein [Methylobacterium sp.]|uniref:DUF6984 family protein n=1 Tax=Methylobacterium sp. TaxID=409 RepID=UPI00260D327F|nr:hypothetical protein [Methylobacterium sp.]MDB5647466.1 hypothetical protein [Methylobacterium sp.]